MCLMLTINSNTVKATPVLNGTVHQEIAIEGYLSTVPVYKEPGKPLSQNSVHQFYTNHGMYWCFSIYCNVDMGFKYLIVM